MYLALAANASSGRTLRTITCTRMLSVMRLAVKNLRLPRRYPAFSVTGAEMDYTELWDTTARRTLLQVKMEMRLLRPDLLCSDG